MKALSTIVIVIALVLAACTSPEPRSASYPTLDGGERQSPRYEAIDDSETNLTLTEENWCTTLEGSAGAWLAANELDLIVDASSGAPATLDRDTVSLLETVESDGASAISPDDVEQLDTFLDFPIPSPLACKAAFNAHDESP